MWRNVRVAALNAMLQLLVIYKYRFCLYMFIYFNLDGYN